MTERIEFNAHPIYVYKFLKRFLFILIFPALKGLLQYIIYRRISGVLLLEGIALGFIVAVSVARVLCFKISADENNLYIKDGIFFRKNAVIPRENLSNITFTEHLLLDIIGAISVSVNTEAGIYGKKDFEFKLYKSDAKRLEEIIYGKKPQIELRFPAGKIALLSATASSALTGLIVGVPVINRIGKLLNIGISEIFNNITDFSKSIKTYFPPAVNVITVLFLLIYGISFIIALSRNFLFRIGTDSEKAEIMSGFYFRKRRIFRKDAINNICLDQTPLMHLFKTYTMRVSVGGYGGEKGERSTVVPAMSKRKIKSGFSNNFPCLSERGKFISPEKNGITKQRFFLIPHTYTFLICLFGSSLMLIFPAFDRLFLFIALVSLGFNAYYGYVSLRAFKISGVSIEKNIIIKCTSRLTVREMYVDSQKIGKIKIIRNPADRRFGTCKISFTVRSESSDTAKVRNISYLKTKEKLNELYGINI